MSLSLGSARWPLPHWLPRPVQALAFVAVTAHRAQLLETRPQQYTPLGSALLYILGEGGMSRSQSQKDDHIVLKAPGASHTSSSISCTIAAKTFCFYRITMLKTNIQGTKWAIKTLEGYPAFLLES